MSTPNRELADFLRRARGRVDPSDVDLPWDERPRRVPGLRREEVAFLAGVSSAYYTRLEQGQAITPSAAVVGSIARAIRMTEPETTHLERLANGRGRPSRRAVQRARPTLLRFVDSLESPALVLGRRTEVLATNRLAEALFAPFLRRPAKDRNYAAWVLLSDEARSLFVDWEDQARSVVESLRLETSDDPDDRATAELVEHLMSSSAIFGHWWTRHGVQRRTWGTKRLDHPVVGRLDVRYESLALPGDPDQTLFVYATDHGSSSRQALDLLASWALTGSSRAEGGARPSASPPREGVGESPGG